MSPDCAKEYDMSTGEKPGNPVDPAALLAPEAVVEQLRATGARIGEVAPLTGAERQSLRNRTRASIPVLQVSINLIGALDILAQAVGQPAEVLRQLHEDSNRWTAVEAELRSMLNAVSGANLIRRQRLDFLAAQAYTIGSRLARDPAHAVLVPYIEEIKRLKSFKRRRKTAQAPGSPQPAAPPAQEDSVTSEDSQPE